jgi:tubulin--tyrosine ligase-like protein 12
MKTVYDKDFINYLKENNIEWDPIYNKLKAKVKKIFILASKDCPQMINYSSRAIYGLDAMIDENYEPYVIEINFQPDCTRACNFIPEFYNDIFNLLFFDKNEGAEKV